MRIDSCDVRPVMLDVATIEAMRKGGIAFVGQVRCVGGMATVFLVDPQDVMKFLADRDQFGATYYGVTKAQYLEWLRHDGSARCGGVTAKGKPCRNYLSGYSQLPINEWLKRDGGYCAIHGGEGSEEARTRGFGSDGRSHIAHLHSRAGQ